MEEMPVLHIHPPETWHGDAYLVANRDALTTLKRIIEHALSEGQAHGDMYVADKEGYDLWLQIIDSPLDGEDWEKAALPYTDEMARDKRTDAIWPWQRIQNK